MPETVVPYHRVSLSPAEIHEVVDCLESGWLTTGPRTARFEKAFAEAVGGMHAVALNSCTAALHLAVKAVGLEPGDAVLVPTMTFAATAEIVRHLGGEPICVDCDPVTLNLDLDDAERKLALLARNQRSPLGPLRPVGIIPVHVGGLMIDMTEVAQFAEEHGLWVVEDAAHAFPAAYLNRVTHTWQRCGEETAAVTCFSFYANKTITTGEGGMAVTSDEALAERIRRLSLHGLSRGAWTRFNRTGSWDYQICEPGYKYNLTDIAAAIGLHQVTRAETMRQQRQTIAGWYRQSLADIPQLDLPADRPDRIHAWHLFPIRLHLERLAIGRDEFIEELRQRSIVTSVHWRPLHLHPCYRERVEQLGLSYPVAGDVWRRLISLPIFPDMRPAECRQVVDAIRVLCYRHQVASQPVRTVVGTQAVAAPPVARAFQSAGPSREPVHPVGSR